MLLFKATLVQLLAILLSPLSGSIFSGFASSAGVAGEMGLSTVPFSSVTGAEGVNLLSYYPPQAQDHVVVSASCALAGSSVVSPSFDSILVQDGLCPQVPPCLWSFRWAPPHSSA